MTSTASTGMELSKNGGLCSQKIHSQHFDRPTFIRYIHITVLTTSFITMIVSVSGKLSFP